MSFFNWDPKYSVGVVEFDEQHKRWIGLLEKLHEAMRVGKGRSVVGEVLAAVTEYTETHFTAEEGALERAGYPGLKAHRDLHSGFVRRIGEFNRALESGQALAVTMEAMNSMRAWLVEHIQREDGTYGEFLNAKGVR